MTRRRVAETLHPLRSPVVLPTAYHGDAALEFERFRALGVDGLFTDFPDVAAKTYGRTPR